MQAQITVRCLRDQGKSIKQIARDLGLSRNTVRRHLRDRTAADYPARAAKPNAGLEPFADDIEKMVEQELIGTRILAELRRRGYQGPRRTFYRYLARHKALSSPSPAVERFETGPARQGQYDWSVYTVPIGGAVTRVYLHSFILGFSRYQHLTVSLDIRQPQIFAALEESFASIGGVPHEMLFDNPRAIVSRPRPNLVFNQHFLEFARFYGFSPRACWPRRAQTKGKVERPFQMVEEHFIKGNTYSDWADLIRRLSHFTAEFLNVRIHGTTRERPLDRLLLEQPLLKQLSATRFISSRECFRKVSLDCLVAYSGSRYSVPWQYASKPVWLRPTLDSKIEILAQTGETLACHELAKEKGQNVIDISHYDGLRERQASRKHQLSCIFKRHFPEAIADRFLEKLLAQYRINAQDQLKRILALKDSYAHEAILTAFEQALQYNTFSYHFLSGLLCQQEPTVAEPPITGKDRTIPALDIERSLESYQTLLFAPASEAAND